MPLNDTFLRKTKNYADKLHRNGLSTMLCEFVPLYKGENLLINL